MPDISQERSLLEKYAARQEQLNDLIQKEVIFQVELKLISFLKSARGELDNLEEHKLKSLNRPNSSTLFNFFRAKNKITPHGSIINLSLQETAEFDTARRILFDMYRFVTDRDSAEVMASAAVIQRESLARDIQTLASGGRLQKAWVEDSLLSSEEGEERVLLGTIKDASILNVLSKVMKDFWNYNVMIENLLEEAHVNVAKVRDKEGKNLFKEFATSPLGEYLVKLLELKSKLNVMIQKKIPQEVINIKLEKLVDEVESARENLGDVDAQKAEQLATIDFENIKDKSLHLFIALPDDSYQRLLSKVEEELHVAQEKVVVKNNQYRR
jgi:GTPase SAR1 family protein